MEKYVLITGGAKNIGAGISHYLHGKGFAVIVADIVNKADSDVADICADYFQVDFANSNATDDFLQTLTAKYNIQHLVNNVGIVNPQAIENLSFEKFHAQMDINFLSAVKCVKAVIPAMKAANYGRIVSTTSRVVLGKKDRTVYSASKGALLSASRTWALELGQYGITVNCVSPGPIATTAFWQNNPKDAPATQAIINNVPLKRIGEVDDVAHAAAFFLEADSGFITGQNLYVCGGVTVGLAD